MAALNWDRSKLQRDSPLQILVLVVVAAVVVVFADDDDDDDNHNDCCGDCGADNVADDDRSRLAYPRFFVEHRVEVSVRRRLRHPDSRACNHYCL